MQILDAVQPLVGLPKQRKSKTSAKTHEGKVKQRVKKILDELNCYYFMPVTNGYSRSGVPDFVACVNGVFVGIETKSKFSTRIVTVLQKKNLQGIADTGGISMEINEDNVEKIPEYLKDVVACRIPTIQQQPNGLYIKLNNQD